jgi:hypothetical protein
MEIKRAYYNHSECHRGWVPLDEQLGLGASELSPLVQEMVSYLGGFIPFVRAQDYLSRYHGIHISHDLVNDTTVMVGQALKENKQRKYIMCGRRENCRSVKQRCHPNDYM